MIAVVSRLWMMSLQAGLLILIVLMVRFFLRKYPKVYSYCLWAIVGLRLLCPVWVELPAEMPVQLPNIAASLEQMADTGEAGENELNSEVPLQGNNELAQMQQTVNVGNVQTGQFPQNTNNTYKDNMDEQGNVQGTIDSNAVINSSSSMKEILTKVLPIIYLTGITVLAVIYLVQYLILKRRVSTAVLAKDNVWFCENINTPFVMGVFRPQIYLPYGLDRVSGRYILKHERMHIKHGDPIIRMIGVLCLCLHWWNPLVWLAVYQMNQDMEMFCDEGFLLHAPMAERKSYADTLLSFAEKKNGLWAELAFGESHTEKRIKNILKRKKESTVSVIAVVLVMILCSCSFLAEGPDTVGEDKINSGDNLINEGNDVSSGENTVNEDNNVSDEVPGNSESSEGETEEAQIYGTWTITDWIMPSGIYALSNEQIEAILGSELEYTESTCRRSLTGTVETVNQYTMEVITGEKLAEDFRENAEALGVAGKELNYYQVDWDGTDIFGQFFYQIDNDNALVYYEGVFFKAARIETSGGQTVNQSFVLNEQGKGFLQSMCYYMPEWSGYDSLDEDFWRNFLFASFTSPDWEGDDKVMTVCGEAEVVSVYREDMGWTEEQVKVSREAVAEYVRLAMGCELPDFESAFEDMEPGQTALYYKEGYYYIGFSDFGSVGFTFKDYEVHEEENSIYALVKFDVYEDVPEEVIDTIEFMICPADNQNGFVIASKRYLTD